MNTPVPARMSNLAITSLVCGIASWVVLPFLAALAAIITGHLARAEIRRDASCQTQGDGMAIAGLVLGYSQIVLTLLAIVAVVLFFGGLAALLAFVGAHQG